MRLYRAIWLALVYVVGATGAAIALLHDSRSVNAAVAVAIGVALSGVALAFQQDQSPETYGRHTMVAAVAGAIVCFAATGWVLLFGPATLPVVGTLLLVSPRALDWLSSVLQRADLKRRRVMDRRVNDQTDLMDEIAPPTRPAERGVQSLTDAELHAAWQISSRSMTRLQANQDLHRQLQYLELRQQVLNELERRHPHTFNDWLLEGAPPDKMPDRNPPPERENTERQQHPH